MHDLHLAVWQTAYAPPETDTAEALRRLDAAADQARAQGAELLVGTEMGLTGYAIGPERVAALAEPTNGHLAQAVAAIAQRHGLAIVYGYPERHPEGGKPFNAAQCIGADGAPLMNYRKTHLFGDMDRAQFSAGDAASQVFTWRGWRLGLLICYDVEFPEAVRALALQGADAVLVPTANMLGYDEVPQLLLPARAYENRVALAYANACGDEGGLHYGGLSTVVQANGTVLAQAARDTTLVLASLLATDAEKARIGSPLPDRRPDLYTALANRPGH